MPTITTTEDSESTNEIVRALNRCIETCVDGAKGYGAATADVRAPELKALFQKYAQQRGGFVLTLQGAIRALGAFPENEGTFRGALHRGWMSCRRFVEGHGDRAVLEGCAFGERATLRAYEAADRGLNHAVPEELRALVQEQYAAIQCAHADIRARLAPG